MNKSRYQFAKLLLQQDNGGYFNGPKHQQAGDIEAGLGVEYIKSTEWKILPKRKGPVPEGLNYKLPDGTQTYANELYSIDGERYPA